MSITDKTRVKIYSDMTGLRSSVRVTGGLAQTVLRFQQAVDVYRGTLSPSSLYTWVYTKPDQDHTLISLTVDTALGAPLVDLSVVRPGDYVIITTQAATGFTGTFPILGVNQTYSGTLLIQTLTIAQIAFTGSAVQQDNSGYQFFRPAKQSIFRSDGRTVVVSQSVPGRVDISIPATTQAVNRDSSNAAYLHENDGLPIKWLQRHNHGSGDVVHVDFATPHSLSVGQQIYLDGIEPASTPPWVSPGVAGSPNKLGASYVSVGSTAVATPSTNQRGSVAILLSNGQLLMASGDTVLALSKTANRLQDAGTYHVNDGTEAQGAVGFQYNWLTTPDMTTARQLAAGCTLGSLGIIAGGLAAGPALLTSTEAYDPGSNTLSAGGAMIAGRCNHTMTDLQNGTCLAVGGQNGSGTAFSTTEIYNGAVWSSGPALNIARFDHRAVRLSNGNVLVVGGKLTSGFKTETCELYNGTAWSLVGGMASGRQGFGCVILPDNRVLAIGGSGHPASQPTGSTVSLNSVEMWDPNNRWWRSIAPMQMHRTNPFACYVPALNRVYVFGGASTQGDDTTVVEYLDLAKMRWYQSPHPLPQTHSTATGALMASGAIVVNGGATGITVHPSPDIFMPGAETISGGSLNNLFRTVTGVPDSDSIEFSSSDLPGVGYASIFGPGYQGPGPNPGAEWVIASMLRAANVTIVYLTVPAGVSSANINVGDTVYVNSLSGSFTSGVKTVTGVAATAFAYADTGPNAGPDASGGSVSQNYAPGAILRPWKQVAATTDQPGPYIYDPTSGLAIVGGDSVTTVALEKGQHYDFVQVANGASFPSSGWIALGFGTNGQTLPIKLLDKYTTGGGDTRLVIDYSFTMPADFPVGSDVTLLAGPSPWQPTTLAEQSGSFYLTASPAGRVAAEALIVEALAAGILENLVVVYPGDAGLGGAGLPTRGATKLSDIVEVFAGDDVSAEILAAQQAPVL